MARRNDLPKSLQTDAVNIGNYVLNRCLIRLTLKETPYKVFEGKKPNVSYFKVLGRKCFIHNNGKPWLDSRSDEGIFVGYSSISKAHHGYNKCTKVIKESIHVVFNKINNGLGSTSLFDGFQLSRYINDGDEGTQDKCNHQNAMWTSVLIRMTKNNLMTLKWLQKPHKLYISDPKMIT